MRILVTGATGFLGGHVVSQLRTAGHSVRALARSEGLKEWSQGPHPVEHLQVSLKDKAAVRKAIAGVEAVYHLAGRVSFREEDGREMYELHVDATRELLSAIVERGAPFPRLIHVSTSGTIAVSKEERVATEADDYPILTAGRWPYYMSKIIQEKMVIETCKRHSIPLVVLNPSLLMGPGDARLSSTWTVVKFLERDLPAMPGGGISIADVRDVATAAVAALTRGDLYGRHLMGLNMSLKEFFGRLERMTGVAAPRLSLPRDVTILGGKILERFARWRKMPPSLDAQEVEIGEHWFWLDPSKAERELGFHARDPHETLFETWRYIEERFPLPH